MGSSGLRGISGRFVPSVHGRWTMKAATALEAHRNQGSDAFLRVRAIPRGQVSGPAEVGVGGGK